MKFSRSLNEISNTTTANKAHQFLRKNDKYSSKMRHTRKRIFWFLDFTTKSHIGNNDRPSPPPEKKLSWAVKYTGHFVTKINLSLVLTIYIHVQKVFFLRNIGSVIILKCASGKIFNNITKMIISTVNSEV